jgi:hypothetical protein
MNVSIHRVESIEVTFLELPADNQTSTFYTKTINVTDVNGQLHQIILFADAHEKLEIK